MTAHHSPPPSTTTPASSHPRADDAAHAGAAPPGYDRRASACENAWRLVLWLTRRPALKIAVVTFVALLILTHHFQELVAQAIWLPHEWRGPGIFLGYMFFIFAFQLFHQHPDVHAHPPAGAAVSPTTGPPRNRWRKTAKASLFFALALLFYCGHLYLRYVSLLPVDVAAESVQVDPETTARVDPPPANAIDPPALTKNTPRGPVHASAMHNQPKRGSAAGATRATDNSIYVPFPMPEQLAASIEAHRGLAEVMTYEPDWLRDETVKYRRDLACTSTLFVLDFIAIAFCLGAALTVTYSGAESLHELYLQYLGH